MTTQKPEQQNWFDMKHRWIWIVGFFAAFVIIMAIGAAMPVDPAEARTIVDELQNEFQYIARVDLIFGHNFFLTLIMFIPFIGPFFGAFSSFSTGIVIGNFAFVDNVNSELLVASLFTAPHTWLEIFAYSLALSQSAFLAIAIIKGRFRQELVRTCIIMAVCALILLAAAVAEVILIAARG